jgi:hypothetical protein
MRSCLRSCSVRSAVPITTVLRPSARELQALAAREMDPRYARSFEQVTPGLVLAVLSLGAIGVCALIVSPYRLAWRLLRALRG